MQEIRKEADAPMDFHRENLRRRMRYIVVFAVLLVAFAVITVVNINSGNVAISMPDILRIIFLMEGEEMEYNIIWKIRLPRILMAAILGGGLSLSGFLLQTFFENPIAGPFVLGISSGAKMVVAIAMIYFLGNYNFVSSYTLIIAAFAVLLGILLGFLVAIIRSTHDKTGKLKLLNLICKLYLTVIRGTPVMVQLLIMYYVIFATVDPGKMVVAVLAFGINSGAYVAEIVRSGIMSIDQGQFEAGRSLGFNFAQTMIWIILPQAFKNVLPALANEFIVLLKETSISGYIGLMDLTRGGDIIRSQTYEALFPLLAVAAIYLVVVVFLTYLVGRLERRLRNNERN